MFSTASLCIVGNFIVTSPIYVVVSLWIENGSIAAFEAYERKAAKIMKRYGGSIERAIRLSPNAEQPNQPFEVHLVRFPGHEMFVGYSLDSELKALSSERNAAIAKSVVVMGYENPPYVT